MLMIYCLVQEYYKMKLSFNLYSYFLKLLFRHFPSPIFTYTV
jgi:hypothetical protein